PQMISEHPDLTEQWIEDCSHALAFAILNINSVIDVKTVVIDASLPDSVIADIIHATITHIKTMRSIEAFVPEVLKGSLGRKARVIGSGLLPLHSSFDPNFGALLKNV